MWKHLKCLSEDLKPSFKTVEGIFSPAKLNTDVSETKVRKAKEVLAEIWNVHFYTHTHILTLFFF